MKHIFQGFKYSVLRNLFLLSILLIIVSAILDSIGIVLWKGSGFVGMGGIAISFGLLLWYGLPKGRIMDNFIYKVAALVWIAVGVYGLWSGFKYLLFVS